MPPVKKKGRSRWYLTYRVPGRDAPITESFATKREATARDYEIKSIKAVSPHTLTPPSPSGLTFDALAERYYSEHPLADSTLAADLYRLRVIRERIGGLQVEALTPDIMDKAMASWMVKRGNSERGAYRKWEMVRAILRWAVKRRIIARNPLEGFAPDRGRAQTFIPPTTKEVQAILAVAPPHLTRAILLAFHLGVRVGASELFGLRWSDFDLAAGWVRVRSADKGGLPWRDIPVLPDFLPILIEWHGQDTGIPWPIHYRGKQVASVKTAWRNALARAGIDRRIRPYDLRHHFATDLLEKGVDPGIVAGLMGHTTTRMVQDIYQRVRRAGKMDAILKRSRLDTPGGIPKGTILATDDDQKPVQ